MAFSLCVLVLLFFDRGVDEAAEQQVEEVALAWCLDHHHGPKVFLGIDPELSARCAAPEKAADRARIRRHATLRANGKAQAKMVTGLDLLTHDLDRRAKVVGCHPLQRLPADDAL